MIVVFTSMKQSIVTQKFDNSQPIDLASIGSSKSQPVNLLLYTPFKFAWYECTNKAKSKSEIVVFRSFAKVYTREIF